VPFVIGCVLLTLAIAWLAGGESSFEAVGPIAVPVGLIGIGVGVLATRTRTPD
jgi:hypothetical protein